MAVIRVLSKDVSNKIAAGEVVERPASVVKELVENALDAGAGRVTVEFSGSGVNYIRVTDDGCGIERSELPKVFLRYATSKLRDIGDLETLVTMGFRGEALAAISSVSHVEILTMAESDPIGSKVTASAGEIGSVEEAGCPRGTTVIVRDLFYNTPARMKFLKKDSSEAAYITDAVQASAIINPGVRFSLIRDGREVFSTPGDGETASAIYEIYGRDLSRELLYTTYENAGMRLSGYVSSPLYSRGNRSMQLFSLNARYVRSRTMQVALEEAYRNRMMTRRYPMCFLNIEMDPSRADINVHPSKMEVKFENEKKIFDLIYYGVKNALEKDSRPDVKLPDSAPLQASWEGETHRNNAAEVLSVGSRLSAEQLNLLFSHAQEDSRLPDKKGSLREERGDTELRQVGLPPLSGEKPETAAPMPSDGGSVSDGFSSFGEHDTVTVYRPADSRPSAPAADGSPCEQETPGEKQEQTDNGIRLVGEAFRTYVIAETGDAVYLIDKHAAHERILYDRLMDASYENHAQQLVEPVSVTLSSALCTAAMGMQEAFLKAGFQIEEFGDNTLIVRTAPMWIELGDVAGTVEEMAAAAADGGTLKTPREERIYHTVACKAATKANMKSNELELNALLTELFSSGRDIMYCPHGRPVAIRLTRHEIEKQFKRIV